MGNRCGLRELTMTDAEGRGLVITTEGQVDFSLLHFDDKTFNTRMLHPWDLTPSPNIYAHFDYMQRGVGNGSCGQNTGTIDKYKCPVAGTYSYTLRFTPTEAVTTGISNVEAGSPDALVIRYNAGSDAVVCSGAVSAGTTFTVYNPGGDLYLTRNERRALGIGGARIGSVAPTIDGWYGSNAGDAQ